MDEDCIDPDCSICIQLHCIDPDSCFICDQVQKLEIQKLEIQKLDNNEYINLNVPTEVVRPRQRRRYLVIPDDHGPEFNEFFDVYDAYTIKNIHGDDVKREVHLVTNYLVEVRNGKIVTKDNERGPIELEFQDNQKYDATKQYNLIVDVCPDCKVGSFQLSQVVFDDLDLEAVDI